MVSFRIQLSQQETAFYETLFSLAGPDSAGFITGITGAQFLATSGLPRDTLHKIWSIADTQQQGRLDKEGFSIACRLVAHAQSGTEPESMVVSRDPPRLPAFGGMSVNALIPQKDIDVISVSDIGNEGNMIPNITDTLRASNIAMSLRKLGLDPLEFVPFQSGPDIASDSPTSKKSDWKITEANRQKYASLFKALDKSTLGFVDAVTSRRILEKSGLSRQLLGLIWEMSDMNSDGRLDEIEFVMAMHLTTKCKKGGLLPNELPQELLDQLIPPKPPGANNTSSLPNRRAPDVPDWKYSRTYLNTQDRSIDDLLRGDVDQIEEEARHVQDLCAQVERDISRMQSELDKRKSVISELSKEKQILTETKQSVSDTRRLVNIDKVSLSRDRAKLQSEIIHLNKLIREGDQDVAILRQTVSQTETDLDRIITQTKALTSHRRDASQQHSQEMDKIEFEQKETAGLVDSFKRISRDEEIQLESQRIISEKNKIVQEMQKPPKDNYVQYSPAVPRENKWAPTLLAGPGGNSVPQKTNVGFGTKFFQN